MALVNGVREEDAQGLVAEVFREMKAVRGWDTIPPIWRVMAVQPTYLKANWDRYKAIMLNGQIDLRVKEMLALAVSMVNRCSYCIDSHSYALRKMGMTDEELVEMVAVIDFFSGTNALSSGLKIEFELPAATGQA
jgi:AhpD family alkylhydroperoxidase